MANLVIHYYKYTLCSTFISIIFSKKKDLENNPISTDTANLVWPSGPLQTGPSHSGFTVTGVGGHMPQNEVEKMMKASHISEEVKCRRASGIPQTSCNTHTHTSDGETAREKKKSEEWGEQRLFHTFGVHPPPPLIYVKVAHFSSPSAKLNILWGFIFKPNLFLLLLLLYLLLFLPQVSPVCSLYLAFCTS